MRVYLDNNVLIDIEDRVLEPTDFQANNIEYYYSSSHIEELLEGVHLEQLSIEKRLDIIEKLAKDNCIIPGTVKPEIQTITPRKLFTNLMSQPLAPLLRSLINNSASNTDKIVDREKILEYLSLRRIEVNNISPEKIFEVINDALINQGLNIQKILLIAEAGYRSAYITLFNLLNYTCYYKDRQTEHSDIARLHDASHAYFAQFCDVFVSHDKRMRQKTKALYSYFDVKTKVLTVEDYNNYMNKHDK